MRLVRRLPSYLVALVAVLLTLFPIVWILSISLKTQRDAFAMPPVVWFEPVWSHYAKVLGSTAFRAAVGNTLLITLGGVLLSLAIAVPAAYALERLRVTGKDAIAVWLILAYLLPEFLFVIPMYGLYQATGLYDTIGGMALAYQIHVLPFAVWMLRSFFQEVPRELDEAARIDGCGPIATLWRVYLPITLPGLAATAVLNAIWIWNELAIALGLTFKHAQTLTVAITSYRGYAAVEWGAMSAASILAILPMLLVAFLAQRWIVKGLTLGAVKG